MDKILCYSCLINTGDRELIAFVKEGNTGWLRETVKYSTDTPCEIVQISRDGRHFGDAAFVRVGHCYLGLYTHSSYVKNRDGRMFTGIRPWQVENQKV